MSLMSTGRLESVTIGDISYKVKFTYYRNFSNGKISSKGGVAVAFITDSEGNVIASGMDGTMNKTFSKKFHRFIASGKLLKKLGIPRK